jgi:hypothetical protein
MSETVPGDDFPDAFASIDAAYRERIRQSDALRPTIVAAICDALSAAGATCVVVTFDGYGDSGQIESIDAFNGENIVEMPTATIPCRRVGYDGSVTDLEDVAVRGAIEALAYELLESTHPGWENEDGAYGEFTLDVAARTISLDHNERFTDVTSYSHEW